MRKTSLAIPTVALCLAAVVVAAFSVVSARAETEIKDGVKVSVTGKLTPTVLPRRGTAPIGVSIGGKIALTRPGTLPKLTRLTIALNRNGHLDTRGLPRCRIRRILPSTSREALASCGAGLVGEGSFAANVKIPEQSPFPSQGKVLAFNGRFHGQRAILAHIYGTVPVPTSYVLPFTISRTAGTYGTVLEADFPEVTGDWGYVTDIAMSLHRRFAYRGRTRGYLNAGCPAPKGFTVVTFPLVRTRFEFDNGLTIATTLNRTCRAKG
jgi:hypothetical protein